MADMIDVIVMDASGSKQYPTQIPKTMTIGKFLTIFKKKLNYPEDAQYIAELKRTNSILDPNSTIESAGIVKGDLIRLRHQAPGGI